VRLKDTKNDDETRLVGKPLALTSHNDECSCKTVKIQM
jgi:hypothetical protein